MRSNSNKRRVAAKKHSSGQRRPQREQYDRETLEELRARSREERMNGRTDRATKRTVNGKSSKKVMTDKKKRRNRRRNKIIMILYAILCIYITY